MARAIQTVTELRERAARRASGSTLASIAARARLSRCLLQAEPISRASWTLMEHTGDTHGAIEFLTGNEVVVVN